MVAITEGDISMVEALRADLKRSSRAERRQLIREIPAPWLRMAVAMSDERWKEAKRDMLDAASQIDAQV
jgi:hypothetical protein